MNLEIWVRAKRARLFLVACASFVTMPAVGPAIADAGEGPCCHPEQTDFGQIAVLDRDRELAMRYGAHVSDAALKYLDLSSVAILFIEPSQTELRWGNRSPDGLTAYPWSFTEGADSDIRTPPNEILPHEIGHDLLRVHFIPNTKSGQYGTDAPDWLDEAVAIAFEFPDEKAGRRCQALSLLRSGGLLPLNQFLSMSHPNLRSIQTSKTSGEQVLYRNKAPKDTPAFYSMALAFSEYLSDKLGNTAVLRKIIDAYSAGEFTDDWLRARVKTASPQLESDEIEVDFLAWMERSYQTDCP